MRFKKLLLVCSALFLFFSVISAQVIPEKSVVQKAIVLKRVTPTIVNTKILNTASAPSPQKIVEERQDLKQGPLVISRPPVHLPDPVWQKEQNTLAASAFTIINQFDVFPYNGVTPPDPSGDAGLDRYVSSTNGPNNTGGTRLAVYDKNGTVIAPLVSFNSLGTQGGGSGDPIVLWDERSSRWFIAEMSTSPRSIRIYVSQTTNPIGTYFQYIIPTPQSAQNFPDYPKFGFWNDKLIMTSNEARVNASNPADAARNVYVFDRAAMVAGNAITPVSFWTDRPSGFTLQNTVPADVDGTLNPDAGSKPLLFRHRDDEINPGSPDNTKDFIEYWELDVNFSNPAASVMTGPLRINVSEFDSHLCSLGIVGCFAQPGTSTRLHAINQMLMYRVQYRRFASHESIVMNWVTDVNGADRGGIRWCEIRRTGTDWFLYQEGTFAPNDGLNRWMGTIAQDKNGNIALGYAVGSGSKFPSLRITGRQANDPLGIMTEPETEVATGTNGSTQERWGDYFHMSVDPVNDENFWLNGMYSTGGVLWRTRVANFKFNTCLSPFNSSASTLQNVTCFGGNNGSVSATPAGGTGPFIYQLNGGAPQASNTFTNLTAGTYNITVTDATGCSSVASATVTQPAQITIAESVQNVLCNGGNNGSVSVNASNGASTLSYQLNGGTPQSSNVFNNLSAGTYSVTVTDANGCSSSKTITVSQPAAVTAGELKTDILCFGGNNGSIILNASGGNGVFQYKLNNGTFQSNNSFNNLTAGSYTVTVIDGNNCSVAREVALLQPPVITSVLSAQEVKCFGQSTGSISIAASGGFGSLQYRIGTGTLQAGNTFNNLASGSYNVTVVDGNGCVLSQSISISQRPQLLDSSVIINPSAGNRFIGSLVVFGKGGTPPYQYSINNKPAQLNGDFSKDFIIGNNSITITDANNCVTALNKVVELSVTNDTWKSFTKILPNPNNGNFYLDMRGVQPDNNFAVHIYDSKGALVHRMETGNTGNGVIIKPMNLGALGAGVYTIRIVSRKNNDRLNLRFVVNRN